MILVTMMNPATIGHLNLRGTRPVLPVKLDEEGGPEVAPQTAHSRARMQQAANKVEESAGEIKSIQNQLHGHQAQLTGSWQGQGASAFMRVYQQFDAEFTQVLKDLNVIHQKLVDTRIKYDATEQQTTGNMSRLGGIING